MNYPYPIGDFKIRIKENNIPAKTSPIRVQLITSDLPQELLTTLISEISLRDVEAKLSCVNPTEWIKIEKGSYNSTSQSVSIIRGLATTSNGITPITLQPVRTISSGSLFLSFGDWRPENIKKIVDDLYNLKNDAINFLAKSIPLATTTNAGTVNVAYRSSSSAINTPSTVITIDTPAIVAIDTAILGHTPNYLSNVDIVDQDRLSRLKRIFDAATVSETKTIAFINLINSL